ncbi:MAG: DNA repair protein RecN [Treponema sp.]|nr:DNA repair protein RecN [Treponema sp.]
MLEELSIRNYALIDSISLSFRPGFNVLSGETGAGKSIIVGSLSFLMGGKAEVDLIRSGSDEASISALVSIRRGNADVTEWLKSRDIDCDDDTIIIRRNIKSSGRSSIFIQNTPVTRGDLSAFMSLLFDLHGQHDHGSLLRKENHRLYLDRFADIEDEVAAYGKLFAELAEKRKTLEASLHSERDREARLELLRYAVDEINAAAPKGGELRELENEAQMLGDFEKLASHVNIAADSLYEGEESMLSLIRHARSALDSAASIDSTLADLGKRLDDIYYEVEDITTEFRSYCEGLSYDPERQRIVDERLALLYRLRKKYGEPLAKTSPGETLEPILAYRVAAEAEIEALTGNEENREKLKNEISVLEKEITARAAALRQKRKTAAVSLDNRITGILKNLGMANARFSPAVTAKTREGTPVYGPWGADEVEFLISANSGEPLKDLSRVASGGELSRIMLAIKSAFHTTVGASTEDNPIDSIDSIETMIFDEIDAGIGGSIALAVGEYLEKIGKTRQIFCVTHLASIAVRAGNHFKVEKRTEGGRTFTNVIPLNEQERRKEIARMLAGDTGEIALAHADDLISKYGNKEMSDGDKNNWWQ